MAIAFVSVAGTETAEPSNAAPVLTVSGLVTGNTAVVLIAIAKDTTTVSSVVGNNSGAGAYGTVPQVAISNAGTARVEIWALLSVGATPDTSITVNYGVAAKSVIGVLQYSGVQAFGVTASGTGATANPTRALTTQDNNNWSVAGFCSQGTTLPTALAGNGTLRGTPVATSGGGGTTNCSLGMVDNTVATAGSVTCGETLAAANWAAAALELRSVLPAVAPLLFTSKIALMGVGV